MVLLYGKKKIETASSETGMYSTPTTPGLLPPSHSNAPMDHHSSIQIYTVHVSILFDGLCPNVHITSFGLSVCLSLPLNWIPRSSTNVGIKLPVLRHKQMLFACNTICNINHQLPNKKSPMAIAHAAPKNATFILCFLPPSLAAALIFTTGTCHPQCVYVTSRVRQV